ncbi:MAG TPA: response regulator [Terracidiphilus sp.]|jgi:PAS domain S-box-containing protein|nr:response regulator [Terracidiphilus sp.]
MSATRILCVDDDVAVLRSIESVLLFNGFEVSAVASVAEALELISKQSFDVLLTDLNIGQPGDGFTIVSAMRRVQPDACTFILTGYPDIDSAIRAIRSQVDDYFAKPFNVTELLTAISSIRSGRRPSSKLLGPIKVSKLVRNRRTAICDQWLSEVMADPELARIPLTAEERIDHVPELLDEVIGRMEDQRDVLSATAAEAARKHGRARYQQGYTIPQILFEARVLQRVLSATIQRELLSLDLSTLVPDAFKTGESLESAIEIAIRSYQSQVPQSLQTSFSHLYQSPYLGVAIADENHILEANDALLRMIGYTREQLMAGEINWLEMTADKYRPLDMNAIEQLREFGTCVPYEKEFVLADGSSFPFLIGAVRLSLDPFEWSVYMVDLTKQRRLQAAEQQVREWESRNLLINRLAHEINNPLAALMFSIHLLGTHANLPSDANELVRDADEMLVRIAASVKRVLMESRSAG